MQLKTLFIRSYIFVIVLMLVILAISLYITKTNKSTIQVYENRYKAILVAINLKKDLEEMTTYCRYYIATGDDDWDERYNSILQVHKDSVAPTDRSFYALNEYLTQLGFSADERRSILETETRTSKLIDTEQEAMKALRGLYRDEKGAFTLKGQPTDSLAKDLISGISYRDEKSAIRLGIDACIDSVMIKTHRSLEATRSVNRRLLNALILLLISISVIMLLTYFTIRRRIMKQFDLIQKVKQAIEQSERKFRFFFEKSPDFIILANHEGRILECNPAFLTFLHVESVEAINSQNLFDFFDFGDEANTILETLQTQPFILDKEINISSLDKRVTVNTLTTFGQIESDEEAPWVIAWIKNVTDKVNRERALKKMQTAVEQSPTAIIITDVKGTITYANKRFSAITGYTLEELLGNNPRLLKSGLHDNDFYENLWDTVLSKKVWQGELYNKRKDGSYFWEEATIAPVLDNKSDIVNLVAIKQDVTSRIEAEAALLESQRQLQELNETKNKLFSIIGHDLRGPIGTLKMLLDVLITDFDQNKPEDIKKMLESVYTSTSVTFDLLENLLMWAKSQQEAVTMTKTSIDLRQAVSENIGLLSELAINKGQTLHNHVPENCLAFADKNMVMTILRNLIMNAIKFSGPTTNIHVNGAIRDTDVVISVKDEGMGIQPEDIEKIFQPAYSSTGTAGEKGTGLGLLLCKDFVERQGGRLWVESEPGKGSTFSFTLPVFDPVNNPSHKEAGASTV